MGRDRFLFRFPLRKVFPVLLLLLTVITAAIVGFRDYRYQQQQMVEDRISYVQKIMTVFQTAAESLDEISEKYIADIIVNYAADTNLKMLLFTGRNNRIIESSQIEFSGMSLDSVLERTIPHRFRKKVRELRVESLVNRLLQIHYSEKNDIIYSFIPYQVSPQAGSIRSDETGLVFLSYSLVKIRETLAREIFFNVLTTSGLILLAAFLFYLLFYQLFSRRLEHLLEVSRRFGDGDLKVRVDLEGRDEFASIGSSFNRMAESIYRLAFYDSLTGLYNRPTFEKMIKKKLNSIEKKWIFIYLDLDGFKHVNDVLGHTVGDEVLRLVGQRLKNISSERNLVARIGGDEFCIMTTETENEEDIHRFCSELLQIISDEYIVDSHLVHISASIGVARFPVDGKDINTLVARADSAMYESKAQGKNRYVMVNRELVEKTTRKKKIIEELYNAIQNNEFYLEYQPIIDYKTRNVQGVEALIRWHSEHYRQMFSPDDFIPILEETGHITEVENRVIDETLQQLHSWHQQGLDWLELHINISAQELFHEEFPAILSSRILKYDVDPRKVVLELTETAIMQNRIRSAAMLSEIRDFGVKISIDDFGTGYSSLSYLKMLPVDIIKIDKSFITGLLNSPEDSALVKTMINLVRDLNKTSIIEGVEDFETSSYLNALGAELMQGYYFSKPLPPETFIDLLNS